MELKLYHCCISEPSEIPQGDRKPRIAVHTQNSSKFEGKFHVFIEYQEFDFINSRVCESLEILGFDGFPTGVEVFLEHAKYVFLLENGFMNNLSDLKPDSLKNISVVGPYDKEIQTPDSTNQKCKDDSKRQRRVEHVVINRQENARYDQEFSPKTNTEMSTEDKEDKEAETHAASLEDNKDEEPEGASSVNKGKKKNEIETHDPSLVDKGN
ncbi:hypothetical protein F3Y22_tig00110481pilonHSYRG00132 [Hibiscus syriacus]|uniref:Uncharacterized protein n=1 Tax=Hibiscus syriacus TaxID=106335 RepID=A0A6A3AGC7_HIBSY|nr:hypothetical protein F3Y22_tig00110481pilonHSYRG00132 [Hibiscus syriacus]